MDIRMPRMDGLEATVLLVGPGVGDPIRVLVLTTFDLDEYVYAALRAGASGFLLKDAGRDELVQAVRVVAWGDAPLAPSVTRRLIVEFARRPKSRPGGRRAARHAHRPRARGDGARRPRAVERRDRRSVHRKGAAG